MEMEINKPVERHARTTMWTRAMSNIPIILSVCARISAMGAGCCCEANGIDHDWNEIRVERDMAKILNEMTAFCFLD